MQRLNYLAVDIHNSSESFLPPSSEGGDRPVVEAL